MNLQQELEVGPPLVLEEKSSPHPPGFPVTRDAEVLADSSILAPERWEFWYDDGTAEPEWVVDRNWPYSTATAAMQTATVLAVILGTFLSLGTIIGPKVQRVAHRHEAGMPFEMTQEYGYKYYKRGPRGKYPEEE